MGSFETDDNFWHNSLNRGQRDGSINVPSGLGGYGQQPQIVILTGNGTERGRVGKNKHTGRRIVTGIGVIALGVAGFKFGPKAYASWQAKRQAEQQDQKHEVCWQSSATLNGRRFNVCYRPSSLYERNDGTIGALATVKAIASQTTNTTTEGTTAGTQASPVTPTYYELVDLLCKVGTDKGTAELDYDRKFIITNAKVLETGPVKDIPDDPTKIIITSAYPNQPSGANPAILGCT